MPVFGFWFMGLGAGCVARRAARNPGAAAAWEGGRRPRLRAKPKGHRKLRLELRVLTSTHVFFYIETTTEKRSMKWLVSLLERFQSGTTGSFHHLSFAAEEQRAVRNVFSQLDLRHLFAIEGSTPGVGNLVTCEHCFLSRTSVWPSAPAPSGGRACGPAVHPLRGPRGRQH